MTGKELRKRILPMVAVAAGLAMFLATAQMQATPIRPDIRKIVSQPQEDTKAQFTPARAGWEGPEMPAGQQSGSSLMQAMNGERLARAERAELLAAATPDPRAILGILAVILLLRLLRHQDEKQSQARTIEPVPDTQDKIAA